MFKIGIDVGSTYTKYCVLDENDSIVELKSEKTPMRQKEYFESRIHQYRTLYPDALITSCGYGKGNVSAIKEINELTALAKGVAFCHPDKTIILDIGGQDTKIIKQEHGLLKSFFMNDKCAAGSGLFLSNVCNMLNISLDDICLLPVQEIDINLSSICAVFAQSEIVELIADNIDENKIISAVVQQILIQAKPLVGKLYHEHILLSGGLTNIENVDSYATHILGENCTSSVNGQYLAAIGAALGDAFDYG